ncbi:hypothetical protein [Micromonospora cathayae]|uniref:Uncharacterized protein n=1 Tax=Micromonospora cathayae TaxID=3028804 RepID=A0ABY7ZWG0_9ACTN|nr:hypothetical protein [Micromonospora sp. HUAS 3]WDZ87223.1 hypothetical protein PVK37_12845 [Micromonospora sp. HUAS 3]
MTAGWPDDRPDAPPPPVPHLPRITVRVKACCGDRLVRERCRCAALRRQVRRAPIVHFTAGRAAA